MAPHAFVQALGAIMRPAGSGFGMPLTEGADRTDCHSWMHTEKRLILLVALIDGDIRYELSVAS